MVDNSLPHRHLDGNYLHDASTAGQCHQAANVYHKSTTSLVNETALASVLHSGAIALPIGPLFGDYTPPSNSISDINMQYNWRPAPTDKVLVWYCSGCGDGPIGIWQAVCVLCSHKRCVSCKVEET
jgi:hypothetical protein